MLVKIEESDAELAAIAARAETHPQDVEWMLRTGWASLQAGLSRIANAEADGLVGLAVDHAQKALQAQHDVTLQRLRDEHEQELDEWRGKCEEAEKAAATAATAAAAAETAMEAATVAVTRQVEAQWASRLDEGRKHWQAQQELIVDNARLQTPLAQQQELDDCKRRLLEAELQLKAEKEKQALLGKQAERIQSEQQRIRDEQRSELELLRAEARKFHDTTSKLCVSQLQTRIAQLQAQLQAQTQSNSAKATYGEALVEKAVKESLPRFLVTNNSAETASCDVHATHPRGDLLVFESKNKSVIQKSDVDKFIRDIDALRRSKPLLAAAMFVSLNSGNIPHKGSFAIEVQYGIPVMWVGLDDPATRAWRLPLCVQILWALAKHRRGEQQGTDALSKTLDALRPWLKRLKTKQSLVERTKAKFQTHVTDMNRFLNTIETDNTELLNLILSLVGTDDEIPAPPPKRHKKDPPGIVILTDDMDTALL